MASRVKLTAPPSLDLASLATLRPRHETSLKQNSDPSAKRIASESSPPRHQWAASGKNSQQQRQNARKSRAPIPRGGANRADLSGDELGGMRQKMEKPGVSDVTARHDDTGAAVITAAPPVKGCAKIRCANERSMRNAFEMLDTQKAGSLERKEARMFLRCVGWVLSDQMLDRMLDGETPATPRQDAPVPRMNQMRAFTYRQLKEVVLKNQERQNGSIEDMEDALRLLTRADEGDKMDKSLVLDIVKDITEVRKMGDGSLSPQEVNMLLALIGADEEDVLNVSDVAAGLYNAICDPPSVLDLSRHGHTVRSWSTTPSSLTSTFAASYRKSNVSLRRAKSGVGAVRVTHFDQ